MIPEINKTAIKEDSSDTITGYNALVNTFMNNIRRWRHLRYTIFTDESAKAIPTIQSNKAVGKNKHAIFPAKEEEKNNYQYM